MMDNIETKIALLYAEIKALYNTYKEKSGVLEKEIRELETEQNKDIILSILDHMFRGTYIYEYMDDENSYQFAGYSWNLESWKLAPFSEKIYDLLLDLEYIDYEIKTVNDEQCFVHFITPLGMKFLDENTQR